MYRLKNLEVLNAHPLLAAVVGEVSERYDIWTVTCGSRPGDPRCHGQIPLIAIDLRCRDKWLGKLIEMSTNKLWAYDPDRPSKKVCLFHDTGQGYHLHFQVHPNTRRIE